MRREPLSKQLDEKATVENSKVNIIRFLGGKSTLFVLVSILLIGLIIVVFKEVSFIFYPIKVFSSTVVLPIILASIGYYLLTANPSSIRENTYSSFLGNTYYISRCSWTHYIADFSGSTIFKITI